MGFLKSFFGAMAAAEVNERKRAEKERVRTEREGLNNAQKVLKLSMDFLDYQKQINCRHATFREIVSEYDIDNNNVTSYDVIRTEQLFNGYKRQLKHFMSYGGDPSYIYEYDCDSNKMDLYIEIVRKLKESGWLDKQEKYVKFAEDTYWLDQDLEKEKKKREWLSELFTLYSNELKQVSRKGDSFFVPCEIVGEAGVYISSAYFLAQSRDVGLEMFDVQIAIMLTDEYIVFYDSETQEEMYYKTNISNSPVKVLYSEFTSDSTAVVMNGIYVIINTNEVERVQAFYDKHNARVENENRHAYEEIDTLSGIEFERVCKRLLEKMGFSVETTKVSGDGGIDLIAYNTQPLLSGKYIIQCKRYAGSVGEPIIRDLYGVVTSERANKGILITTGRFTKSAVSFAENKPLELIDGAQLKILIEQHLNTDSGCTIPSCLSPKMNNSTLSMESNNAYEKPNQTKYIFYSPNATNTFDIKVNRGFIPFGYEENYRKVNSRMAVSADLINDTGHMVALLQDYIYNDKYWLWGNVSRNLLYDNKREALRKVLTVIQNIKTSQYLYPLYLSTSAQSYFMLGEWKTSIRYYEELLSQPGVIVEVDNAEFYAGELELAAQIVHNICLILLCVGQNKLCEDYMSRYSYMFALEKSRTERLIRNNPDLKKEFEEDWRRLSDISAIKDFYIDNDLMWGYGVDGNSILSAIYSDCKRNGLPARVKYTMYQEIRTFGDGRAAMMDYETGKAESSVLEIEFYE